MVSEGSPPVEVEHLTRSYGKRRGIVDVSFTVRRGEIFAFLGPNGAGKTTTIRQLMGLLRPTSGSARIFGLDCWSESHQAKARIGFLPGEMRLYEGLTGREFLDFFASFRRHDDPGRRAALAERLELDLHQRIRHLSKGNRQKLGIVQALMHGAPLLILDEPSSGLDPLKQHAFLEVLREERAAGRTVFLSSHALGEVERIADRAAIIREGRLVAVEEVSALKAKRARRMELQFAAPVDQARLEGIAGVRVLALGDSGRRAELAVRGALGPLLHRLGELPVEDLSFAPADLESIFLHYYGEGGAASE
jgi:ABC-2 type transport system ATP-binding protein